MRMKGIRKFIFLFLIFIPFLLNAQIDRFKMYESKPAFADSVRIEENEADSIKMTNYKLGYFQGKKFAEEKGSNNSSDLIGPPVLEPEELKAVSSKQNKSPSYQLGFEDGYYGKQINSNNSTPDPKMNSDTYKTALIVTSIYLLVVFSPVIISFAFLF